MSDFLDFDWSPIGPAWWREQQELARASDLQLRFACSFARCGSQKEAAREAGYAGDEDTLKQAGYDAARSKAVVTLLGLLAEEHGDELVVDRAELRRIFSRVARSGSASDRIRAGEALIRLEEREREDLAEKDPVRMLAEIGHLLNVITQGNPHPHDRIIVERLALFTHLPAPRLLDKEGSG